MQLSRKKEKPLGVKYFIFVKIFAIFSVLRVPEVMNTQYALSSFYEHFLLAWGTLSLGWNDPGVLFDGQ